MNNDFLKRFIKEEKYLQNPPLETKQFIEFCEKRGIKTNENELEFFEKEGLLYPIIRIDRPIGDEERIQFINEKDGKTYWRPTIFGLQNGEKEVERYKVKFYSSYGFEDHEKEYLSQWVEKGNLFDPSTKPFKDWASFKGEELNYDSQRYVSFYSTFQIYWLCTLNKNKKSINEDIVEFKEWAKKYYDEYLGIFKFLVNIQNVYMPYGQSGSRHILISGDDKKWLDNKRRFDTNKELNASGMTIENVVKFYGKFSRHAIELLGGDRGDWMQLMKSIDWDKKDSREGMVRLGIEFLQWALMLKRFIEDHTGHEILDVDEVHLTLSEAEILAYDTSKVELNRIYLRAVRNNRNYDPDEKKNYYDDVYKRKFYLANDFGLDYQPRLMLFVEGKTEEVILPKFFEWYYDKPENHGIEIVNFEGVTKLLSTAENAEKLKVLVNKIDEQIKAHCIDKSVRNEVNEVIHDLKEIDIVISNWTSFISYNLEKWQIMPFFVSDNEGNAWRFLSHDRPISYKGSKYNVPGKWKYVWGVNNADIPFKGKDFEMANYNDDEIAQAVSEVLNETVSAATVKEIRERSQGINQINPQVKKNKLDIAEKLFTNLIEKSKNDDTVLDRPVCKVMDLVLRIASLNHLPSNRDYEKDNQVQIEKWLKGIE